MSLATNVKRAPKWAWYTVAGVAVGGFGLKMYRHRTTTAAQDATSQSDQAANDPTNYSYGAGGVNGVIVPPVIVPPADNTGDAAGLLGSVLGGVGDLTSLVLSSVETIIGPTQESQQGLVDTTIGTLSTLALANAGSPPTPQQNGMPPIATPVPAPAPAQTTPIIPQGSSSVTLVQCPSKYPHQSSRGCYRTTCHDGHWWHYYAPNDDPKIKLAATC